MQVERDFGQTPVREPHPCSADWNNVRNGNEHYKSLICVQRHKCVGTYCLRSKKRADGTEYGQPYCRFGFDSNSDDIELTKTERQSRNDTEQQLFKRGLSNCQKGLLNEQDCSILKQRFIQTAEDTTSVCWDNAPHLFFDNRCNFE